MVGTSQESGWAQGEESVLSDQPLPVALTMGAREDEIISVNYRKTIQTEF